MILCIALLATIAVSFASCASKRTVPISFGKKYRTLSNENNYYIFNSDHTGVYENRVAVDDIPDSDINYTLSGMIDFVWREASNGAVYMFKTEVHYNEDHTERYTISIITDPIYFSDDCFVYTTYSQYGGAGTNHLYSLEGSDLEKSFTK